MSEIIVILGLCLFEIVSSIDNAIINAEVLGTMKEKARRWFLMYGLFFAVFVVRGLLPWLIVWAVNSNLGPIGALTATFSNDPVVLESIEKSAPILLVGGGIFLLFLFFHWLFMEDKNFCIRHEEFFIKQKVWFHAVTSIILLIIVWFGLKTNEMMAIGALVGSTAFFITNGFKQGAELEEEKLLENNFSDVKKIMYLEILDMTFSTDGVLGAFAFTLSVPIILIGNGLGALVVRQLTLGNIHRIKKYIYLKNGAMYSIFFLSLVMIIESFGTELPKWLSPVITVATIAFFWFKSHRHLKKIS